MTLTNNQNLGGTRLIRGYPEVKQGESVGIGSKSRQQSISEGSEDKESVSPSPDMTDSEIKDSERRKQEMEDYENEKSEGTREIDHLIICIHG
jgi:hypothetical protein